MSSSVRSVIADTVDGAVTEIREAADFGADIVELRLDFLKDLDLLDPKSTLKRLLGACDAYKLPAIVTFRPEWEGYASLDHFLFSPRTFATGLCKLREAVLHVGSVMLHALPGISFPYLHLSLVVHAATLSVGACKAACSGSHSVIMASLYCATSLQN